MFDVLNRTARLQPENVDANSEELRLGYRFVERGPNLVEGYDFPRAGNQFRGRCNHPAVDHIELKGVDEGRLFF